MSKLPQATTIRPGPRNLITDVPGIKVGNADDEQTRTGVTVVRPDHRCVASVDVRGGGPGTRETDLLSADNLIREIDAIVLSGGSVYGLEAASGVAAWLGHRGFGYEMMGSPKVAPIVPSAILFDLNNGGDKEWGETPPYRFMGTEAIAETVTDFGLGNVGAGYGARAGLYKGGLGSASFITDDGFAVGALIAVNSFGSPVMPGSSTLWAQPYAIDGEMGPAQAMVTTGVHPGLPDDTKLAAANPGHNTTIGIVATNAILSGGEAKRLAVMAQDGLSRSLRPVHTPVDGDVLFTVATGERPLGDMSIFKLLELGALAADCVARAVGRAVWEAETLGDAVSLRDRIGR